MVLSVLGQPQDVCLVVFLIRMWCITKVRWSSLVQCVVHICIQCLCYWQRNAIVDHCFWSHINLTSSSQLVNMTSNNIIIIQPDSVRHWTCYVLDGACNSSGYIVSIDQSINLLTYHECTMRHMQIMVIFLILLFVRHSCIFVWSN